MKIVSAVARVVSGAGVIVALAVGARHNLTVAV